MGRAVSPAPAGRTPSRRELERSVRREPDGARLARPARTFGRSDHMITAVFTGIVVLLAGNLPWAGLGRISGLAAWNLRVWTGVPWAIVPMALYLAVYWRVISGGRSVSAGAVTRRAA